MLKWSKMWIRIGQEEEIITKDVWDPAERKMSRGELFLRAKIVVCRSAAWHGSQFPEL